LSEVDATASKNKNPGNTGNTEIEIQLKQEPEEVSAVSFPTRLDRDTTDDPVKTTEEVEMEGVEELQDDGFLSNREHEDAQICIKSRNGKNLENYMKSCRKMKLGKHEKVKKDKEKVKVTQVDKSNLISESIQGCPSTSKHKTLIKEIYFPPDPAIITGQLYKVVMYILNENIPVNQLNTVWTQNCQRNTKETRHYFRHFTEEEDTLILTRLKFLTDSKIITNAKSFLDQLNDQNGKTRTREKEKATRNIVGLYVGQDLQNRIAHVITQRLIFLLTGSSLTNPYLDNKKKEETIVGLQYKTKQPRKCWSLDEDKVLVEMVLRNRIGQGIVPVEHVVESNVDWDSIGDYFKEFGRTKQTVRERWNRTVKVMLLEVEQEPETIYEYQKSLLGFVLQMGVTDRKEIHWKEVAKVFAPKTSSVLSQDFWNLIRHKKCESLSDKLSAALECLERPTKSSISSNMKKNETKSQLLDFYSSL